jgi:hypothetical protein
MATILDRRRTGGSTPYWVGLAALSFLSFLLSFFGLEPFLIALPTAFSTDFFATPLRTAFLTVVDHLKT